jgi:hypothetical protein
MHKIKANLWSRRITPLFLNLRIRRRLDSRITSLAVLTRRKEPAGPVGKGGGGGGGDGDPDKF